MLKRTLTIALVLGAFSLPAAAQFPTSFPNARIEIALTVDQADLDLTRADDADRLLLRIHEAAQELCQRSHGRANVGAIRCVQRTVAATVARADHPALTSAWERARG